MKKKYTNKELIDKLIRLKNKLDEMPSCKKIPKGYPVASTFVEHFGSWRKALIAAGLNSTRDNIKDMSNKDLLKILKKFAKELGRTPTQRGLNKRNDLPGATSYIKRFGSFNKAISLAKLKPNNPLDYLVQRFPDKYLLNKLRKFKDRKGYISCSEIEEDKTMPSRKSYTRHFGSFNNALRKAGILINTEAFTDAFKRKFWKAWQSHCEVMANVMYDPKWIRYQESDFTDKAPDILVVTKRKHIDAKVSGYSDFQEQIDEYTKDFCKLEFWCIWKGIENISNPRVKYYYAEELAGIMKVLDRDDLAKKCYLFKRGVIPDCYQKELEVFIKDKNG